jgi:calcium-dependent protein kinase
LLFALNHCHSNKVTHRDIKLENIIVNEFDHPKIIDFGLSKDASAKQILKSMAGTPYFMAPEILQGKSYNEKVDMWSLGVVIYTMLCGYRPFDGENAKEVFSAVETGDYRMGGKNWGNISNDAKDFVSSLLEINPKKRISAKQALKHPWFGLISEIKIKSVVEEEEKLDSQTLASLQTYREVHRLRKAVLNVLVKMLKPKETFKYTEIFMRMDKDQTGSFSSEELAKSLKACDPTLTVADARSIVKELDFAENKKINYSEFLSA